MRAASRFPGAGPHAARSGVAQARRMRWIGTDGDLFDVVRDHALALGIDLVTASDTGTVDAQIVEDGSLSTIGGLPRNADVPVLVVSASGPDDAPTDPGIWRLALASGAVALVRLPAESELLLSHLAELSRPRTSTTVIGVGAGCGGAGASSFAARLAAAARRHGPVTLIDADPLGGGLDLVVEAPDPPGIRWPDTAAIGPDDGAALRDALPEIDGVRVLLADAGPGPDEASLTRVLTALTVIGGTVIVDLGTQLLPTAAGHLDRIFLVVPGSDHAVRSAARRLLAWRLPAGLVKLVVRRRREVAPAEAAAELGVDLAGSFRESSPGTVPLLDVRRGGADRLCRNLLLDLKDSS